MFHLVATCNYTSLVLCFRGFASTCNSRWHTRHSLQPVRVFFYRVTKRKQTINCKKKAAFCGLWLRWRGFAFLMCVPCDSDTWTECADFFFLFSLFFPKKPNQPKAAGRLADGVYLCSDKLGHVPLTAHELWRVAVGKTAQAVDPSVVRTIISAGTSFYFCPA